VENAADAEDLLQATFLKGGEKGDTVREHGSVVALLFP
jgi:DNA-directed RNA polymerase specialized sigma24 family protein